ncbi:MAG TPA: hypothetical protein VLM40_13610 [Gemmata sp.]|nr:hypothetical protein [Gemmata sp.]
MSDAGRKKWWRAAAAAVIGGTVATAAWLGFSRDAGAEPPFQIQIPQIPDSAAAAPAAVPQSSTPVVSAAVPLPRIDPPPALPAIPVIPAGGQSLSAAEGPPSELPPIPAAPASPPGLPSVPLPGPEMNPPQVPPMMGGIVPLKPVEPKKEKPDAAGALPVPPPPGLNPPAPAANTAQPPAPPVIPPVSSLPGTTGGTSVKPEQPGGGTATVPPVMPVIPAPNPSGEPVKLPAIPTAGGSASAPVEPVSLPKPPAELPKDAGAAAIPSIPIKPIAPTSGEDPMIQLHKAAALAVIGSAFMLPTTPAAAHGKDEKSDLAALKTQIETANTKLTEIQRDLKTLTELLLGKKDDKGIPIPTDPGIVAQMKTLADKLHGIEKDLSAMRSQTSLRPPTGTTPDTRIGKGTVRVVNEYPIRIEIGVNGVSYHIMPGKSQDIEIPAGEFTYQLMGNGAVPKKSIIKEKETVTLRIR